MNPLVELTNNTASGALDTSTDIMAWPVGYVVYFVIWLSIIGTVVVVIKKWF